MDINKTIKILYKNQKLILGWLLLFGVVYLLFKNNHKLENLSELNPSFVFYITLVNAGYYFSFGLGQNESLIPIGIKLKFKEWYSLALITALFNQFSPAKGGVFVRGLLLHKRSKLHPFDFSLTLFYQVLIGTVIWSTIGALLFLFSANYQSKTITIAKYLYFLSVPISILVFKSPKLFLTKVVKSEKLSTLLDVWKTLHTRRSLITISGSFVLAFIIEYLRNVVAVYFFNFPITPYQTALSTMMILSLTSLPLLPGSLGIREFSYVFAYGVWGIPMEVCLFVSLIDRLMYTLFIIVTGSVAYFKFK